MSVSYSYVPLFVLNVTTYYGKCPHCVYYYYTVYQYLSVNDVQRIGILRVTNSIPVCVAGRFANMRSDWRHFLVNCGTLVDRFLAYTYAKINHIL